MCVELYRQNEILLLTKQSVHTFCAFTQKFPAIVGRYVPFAAVAAANCINIPFMRSRSVLVTVQVVFRCKKGTLIRLVRLLLECNC